MPPFQPQHLRLSRYGDFTLTAAVRPGTDVPVVPVEGYRISRYRDRETRISLPQLTAAVSAERIFDLFLDLLEPLGENLHVVLETSHVTGNDQHEDLCRSDIDAPVLLSHFCDFEELLVNDGCTGVAVVAAGQRMEVQLDEHKLFHIYAHDLKPFRRILRQHGIVRDDELKTIADAPHLHHSESHQANEFVQLASRLGVTNYDSVLFDESDMMGS